MAAFRVFFLRHKTGFSMKIQPAFSCLHAFFPSLLLRRKKRHRPEVNKKNSRQRFRRFVKKLFLASENQTRINMKTANYYTYIPKRFATDDVRINRIRQFIYDFKSGKRGATEHAIKLVSDTLTKWYGVSCCDYVLCCIPAATNSKYIRRFKRFADEVSKRTGIQNGTAHVNIFGMREAKHNNAQHIVSESFGYLVSADTDFFEGKNVILFDDLITTGATANEFAEELESVGANVLGAMFLARTAKMN